MSLSLSSRLLLANPSSYDNPLRPATRTRTQTHAHTTDYRLSYGLMCSFASMRGSCVYTNVHVASRNIYTRIEVCSRVCSSLQPPVSGPVDVVMCKPLTKGCPVGGDSSWLSWNAQGWKKWKNKSGKILDFRR